MKPARRRVLDRLQAEPPPGWLCAETLVRELGMVRADLLEHLRALVSAGRVQGHSLCVFWRAVEGS